MLRSSAGVGRFLSIGIHGVLYRLKEVNKV